MKRDTVLITGSSRGIGSAIAKTLAKENYNIVINYKENETEAKKVFEEIKTYNSNVLMIQADIRKTTEVENMFNEIEKKCKIFSRYYRRGVGRYFQCKCAWSISLHKESNSFND